MSRDYATCFWFESGDSMILLFWSHQVLKGSHKTESMSMFLYFASQGCITNLKMHFWGSTLHKNA